MTRTQIATQLMASMMHALIQKYSSMAEIDETKVAENAVMAADALMMTLNVSDHNKEEKLTPS